MSSSFAKRIAAARASKGGNYFTHGKGQLVVNTFHRTLDGEDNVCFVLECVVMSSTPTRTDSNPNAPGTTVSSVFAVGKHGNVAWGNLKSALAAVGRAPDASPEDIERLAEALIEDCVVDDKPVEPTKFPARGILIDYETRDSKPTKKTGAILILPRFSPVKQTPAQIAEMRKALGEK
jgi:hypothetical protein